jgi:hypothetical protein
MWERASDFSDWWDEQHKESIEALDAFIEEHPDIVGVAVAGTFTTLMDVAEPSVDMWRFGAGAAEGPGGVVKDGIRFLGLMGPVAWTGKQLAWAGNELAAGVAGAQKIDLLGKKIPIASGLRLAKLIDDPGNGLCWAKTTTRALTQTGQKVFASVKEFAELINHPLDREVFDSIDTVKPDFERWIKVLKEIGAKISTPKAVSTFQDVEKMLPRDGSVVLVDIVGKSYKTLGEEFGHSIHVFRDVFGKVKIMTPEGRIVSTLQEVGGTIGGWRVRNAVVLENVFGKIMNNASQTGILAMGVSAITGFSRQTNETIAQVFDLFKRARQGKPPAGARAYHVVGPGETLQDIARMHYGDAAKWAVLAQANKDKLAKTGNLIAPSQRLLVPELPHIPQFSRAGDKPAIGRAATQREDGAARPRDAIRSAPPSRSAPATSAAKAGPAPASALAAGTPGETSNAIGRSDAPAHTRKVLADTAPPRSDHTLDTAEGGRRPAHAYAAQTSSLNSLEEAPLGVLSRLVSDAEFSLRTLSLSTPEPWPEKRRRIELQLDELENATNRMGDDPAARKLAIDIRTLKETHDRELKAAGDEQRRIRSQAAQANRVKQEEDDRRSRDLKRIQEQVENTARKRIELEILERKRAEQDKIEDTERQKRDDRLRTDAERLEAERTARDRKEKEQEAIEHEIRERLKADRERIDNEARARLRDEASRIDLRQQEIQAEKDKNEQEKAHIRMMDAKLEEDAREQLVVKARLYLAEERMKRPQQDIAWDDKGLSAGTMQKIRRDNRQNAPGGDEAPGQQGNSKGDAISDRNDRNARDAEKDALRDKELADRRARDDAEAARRETDARRLREEADIRRDEDARRFRQDEERNEADGRWRQEQAEARRREDEARWREEQAESRRQQEEEDRRREEEAEARRQQEEDRRREEEAEARRRQEEERRREEEAEARRQQEEDRRREQAAEARRREDDARKQKEDAEKWERDHQNKGGPGSTKVDHSEELFGTVSFPDGTKPRQ